MSITWPEWGGAMLTVALAAIGWGTILMGRIRKLEMHVSNSIITNTQMNAAVSKMEAVVQTAIQSSITREDKLYNFMRDTAKELGIKVTVVSDRVHTNSERIAIVEAKTK